MPILVNYTPEKIYLCIIIQVVYSNLYMALKRLLNKSSAIALALQEVKIMGILAMAILPDTSKITTGTV